MTTTPPAPDAALLCEKLKALMAKATPGPWAVSKGRTLLHVGGNGPVCAISVSANHVHEDYPGCKREYVERQEANAALIVELQANLPTILAALSRDGGADGWRAGAEAMRETAAAMCDERYIKTMGDAAIAVFDANTDSEPAVRRTAARNAADRLYARASAFGEAEAAIRALPLPAPPAAQKEEGT